MGSDFEQLLKDVFGDSFTRLTQLQRDSMQKMQSRLQEFTRAAMHDELTKLHNEIADLRGRVATLEAERVQNAADSVQSAF